MKGHLSASGSQHTPRCLMAIPYIVEIERIMTHYFSKPQLSSISSDTHPFPTTVSKYDCPNFCFFEPTFSRLAYAPDEALRLPSHCSHRLCKLNHNDCKMCSATNPDGGHLPNISAFTIQESGFLASPLPIEWVIRTQKNHLTS